MIKYLFYVLSFVLSIDVWGQQQILSLTDCIARALDANYGIRIARNEQLELRKSLLSIRNVKMQIVVLHGILKVA